VTTPVDPLAFCVGPVEVRYGGNASKNRVSPDLARLIDKDQKVLTSVTGEIRTDYGRGIYTVDAPKCQAAAGFLAEQPEITLQDLTIRCRNRYGSIVVVPLDGRPLAESRQVLVQAGTVARPAGWIARQRTIEAKGRQHDGLQIMRKGSAPILVENTAAEISLANPRLRKAIPLDTNGQPMGGKVPVRADGRRVTLTLPENTLYTILCAD
jgi:hypothetical protein